MLTTAGQNPDRSALRGRVGRGAIVLGAHVALIYGVAASLGIVRSPVAVDPMQAVLITETQEVEQPPLEPELSTPQVAELAMPEPLFEVPVEDAPPLEAPPANAITASPAPAAGPPSADLAVTHSTQPAYPPASRRMNEEGVVALAVLVDERGRPAEVRVERSSGFPRLDQAAVEGCASGASSPRCRTASPPGLDHGARALPPRCLTSSGHCSAAAAGAGHPRRAVPL